jgi:hypothetical protein
MATRLMPRASSQRPGECELVKKSSCRGGPCRRPGATTRVAPTTHRHNAMLSHVLSPWAGFQVTINGRFWVTAETALIHGPKRLVYLSTSITGASAPRIQRLVVWNCGRSYWTPASARPESICLNKPIRRSGAARSGKRSRTGHSADCLWNGGIPRQPSSLSSQHGQLPDGRYARNHLVPSRQISHASAE